MSSMPKYPMFTKFDKDLDGEIIEIGWEDTSTTNYGIFSRNNGTFIVELYTGKIIRVDSPQQIKRVVRFNLST